MDYDPIDPGDLVVVIKAPITLVRRAIASWRWKRFLRKEMHRRPKDHVYVFDQEHRLLGKGLRTDIDDTHVGYAVPFSWFGRATSVENALHRPIRGARLYFGPKEHLLEPLERPVVSPDMADEAQDKWSGRHRFP